MKSASASIATFQSVPVVTKVIAPDDHAPRVEASGVVGSCGSRASSFGKSPKEYPSSIRPSFLQQV